MKSARRSTNRLSAPWSTQSLPYYFVCNRGCGPAALPLVACGTPKFRTQATAIECLTNKGEDTASLFCRVSANDGKLKDATAFRITFTREAGKGASG
jgi:hypothetical protein